MFEKKSLSNVLKKSTQKTKTMSNTDPPTKTSGEPSWSRWKQFPFLTKRPPCFLYISLVKVSSINFWFCFVFGFSYIFCCFFVVGLFFCCWFVCLYVCFWLFLFASIFVCLFDWLVLNGNFRSISATSWRVCLKIHQYSATCLLNRMD